MRERTATILAGAFAGTLVCALLAMPDLLPRALADEPAPLVSLDRTAQQIFRRPLNGSDFVKPPEYAIEPWVDMEAQSERVVRKIAFGRTTFVTVMTTSSGVYSSDGLASPHVRYPGINARRDDMAPSVTVVALLEGGGWLRVSRNGAGSFGYLQRIDPGPVPSDQ